MTLPLIICIVLCIVFFVGGAIFLSRKVKSNVWKRRIILFASLATIVCHYSSLLYHAIGHAISPDKVSTVMAFLHSNPNLIIPMYPCNVIMWGMLIFSLIKKEDSKLIRILADFLFLFGIVSGIAGMVANGDYFNPNVVKDYDIYKSCVAHAFMNLSILLIPVFGYFKLDALNNLIRTAIGVVAMGLIGLWDAVVIACVGNEAQMRSWNPMFLFNSPFGDTLPIVKFYIVMPMFLAALFIVLTIVELFMRKKGDRWWNNIKKVNI